MGYVSGTPGCLSTGDLGLQSGQEEKAPRKNVLDSAQLKPSLGKGLTRSCFSSAMTSRSKGRPVPGYAGSEGTMFGKGKADGISGLSLSLHVHL